MESAPGNLQPIPMIAMASFGYTGATEVKEPGERAGISGTTIRLARSTIIVAFTTAKLFATDCGTASVPMERIKEFELIWFNAEAAVERVEY